MILRSGAMGQLQFFEVAPRSTAGPGNCCPPRAPGSPRSSRLPLLAGRAFRRAGAYLARAPSRTRPLDHPVGVRAVCASPPTYTSWGFVFNVERQKESARGAQVRDRLSRGIAHRFAAVAEIVFRPKVNSL